MNIAKKFKALCCEPLLNIGKPPKEEVLYSEIIKKPIPQKSAERLTLEMCLNIFKITPEERVESSKETPTSHLIAPQASPKEEVVETTQKEVKKPKKTRQKSTTISPKKAMKITLYCKDFKKHYGEVDKAFMTRVVNNLGTTIYREKAELVDCNEIRELDTIRKNFLIKKLEIDAPQKVLDDAILTVCDELKKSRKKYRATFYYRLAKMFDKESMIS